MENNLSRTLFLRVVKNMVCGTGYPGYLGRYQNFTKIGKNISIETEKYDAKSTFVMVDL